MAYKLRLSRAWMIHNAFPLSLLKLYKEDLLTKLVMKKPLVDEIKKRSYSQRSVL